MIAYLINIFFIIFWGGVILVPNYSDTRKKVYCIIVTIQWILISGLRHISVGPDTYAYKIYRFEKTLQTSWEDLFDNFYNIIILKMDGKDPGYPILEKIFQMITPNYQLFLLFIAIFFMVPLGIFVYQYSKRPILSFIIYSCLFYSFFAITGHRQTIATGLVLFRGYELIKKRNLFEFLLIIIIGMTIHKSVICLIPFYFIAHKKITSKYIISVISTFIFIFIFKNKIMLIISALVGYEQYGTQFSGAGTPTFTLFFILIVVAAIYKSKKILLNDTYYKDRIIWYNALFMALIYLPLTYVDPSAMRIVQYFSIFIILLIPEIVSSFKPKEGQIISFIGICLMIILFIRQNPQYCFFWEGGF